MVEAFRTMTSVKSGSFWLGFTYITSNLSVGWQKQNNWIKRIKKLDAKTENPRRLEWPKTTSFAEKGTIWVCLHIPTIELHLDTKTDRTTEFVLQTLDSKKLIWDTQSSKKKHGDRIYLLIYFWAFCYNTNGQRL